MGFVKDILVFIYNIFVVLLWPVKPHRRHQSISKACVRRVNLHWD